MKSFKLLFVSLLLSSLSANSELNLDLKEYEIEVIIFKHINVITDENFNDEFTTPSIKTLSFYNPTLQINENAYLSKPKDNFFNRLFKDFNPIKKSNYVLTKDKDISKVSNPKTWYRKTDNLVVLKKINNKLETNSNYELLDSFKWIQNIDYKDDAQFLFYEDKQKEYEIEVIIFKHTNVLTDENFDEEFTTPSLETITFYKPTLQINEKAYQSKPKDNIFNRLFKDFNPIKKSNNVLTKDQDISKASNPKTWYRKTDNLVVLKKINKKLETNSNYELLDSFKWIQNIDYKDDAQFLFYEDKQKEYGLYLKFYRSRFLHADLKSYLGVMANDSIDITKDKIAKFEKKILEVNKENNKDLKIDLKFELNKPNKYVDINSNEIEPSLNISKSNEINIFIDEQRRIFNKEIHYFDHPVFGLIISINEI